MRELGDAIEAADWPRALRLALDTWRETRAPALADLVDRIAARAPALATPTTRVHPWWIKHARFYDPAAATTLIATVREHEHNSDIEWHVLRSRYPHSPIVQALATQAVWAFTSHRNLLERLVVMAQWPHDPRVATVIARWFAELAIAWHPEPAALALVAVLADQLIALRDPRVIATLERVVAEPRGKTSEIRRAQRTHATRAIEALAELTVPALDEVTRWCPAPVAEPALDDRTLWAAATDAPSALVLADYLIERGDRRGEIITLAAHPEHARESSTLLHRYWDRWMGDLALVLDRGSCVFEHGLLRVAGVGLATTPEWAYAKAAGHRELASMHTVRPGWRVSAGGYVGFLDALAVVPPTVRLAATMIAPLVRRRATWAEIRTLELMIDLPKLPLDLVAAAAAAMPEVTHIALPMPGELDEHVVAAVHALPAHFPALVHVRVDAARVVSADVRAALVELAKLPYVEVDHGRYHP